MHAHAAPHIFIIYELIDVPARCVRVHVFTSIRCANNPRRHINRIVCAMCVIAHPLATPSTSSNHINRASWTVCSALHNVLE